MMVSIYRPLLLCVGSVRSCALPAVPNIYVHLIAQEKLAMGTILLIAGLVAINVAVLIRQFAYMQGQILSRRRSMQTVQR